jgi:hypothetical protein
MFLVLVQFGTTGGGVTQLQNRGAVEAVNKLENLVILEWHSITEPRADRGPQSGSPAGVVVATGS